MHCPFEKMQLAMSDRSGGEIDYCPKCRSVWPDCGELDKLIERSVPSAPQQAAVSAPGGYDDRPHRNKFDSFLSDVFDF
jgi:Zn-finger nucleic acid-binding protein